MSKYYTNWPSIRFIKALMSVFVINRFFIINEKKVNLFEITEICSLLFILESKNPCILSYYDPFDKFNVF